MGDKNSSLGNELDRLIEEPRQAKNPATGKTAPRNRPEGLRPSDILFLPEGQARLVNHLSRLNRARLADLQQTLALPQKELVDILSSLKEQGYIKAALHNGEIYYHIKFAENLTSPKGILHKGLWNAVRLDNAGFLKNVALFKTCKETDLEFIRNNAVLERFERNDVVLWQGEPARALFIIKSGVVAVTNILSDGSINLLTYLEQGDFFGEGGLLTERASSATITAMTPVELLSLPKVHFYKLLAMTSSIPVELSRVLANRLSATNIRLANQRGTSNFHLVISAEKKSGATTLAIAMALKTAATNQEKAAYLEFPQHELSSIFEFSPEIEQYTHPGGFEVINSAVNVELPRAAQAALLLDHAASKYKHIIASISWELADQIDYLIGNASQIILVAPLHPNSLARLSSILPLLKLKTQANKTRIFTVLCQTRGDLPKSLADANVDFLLPYLGQLPAPVDWLADNIPEPLSQTASKILDMLGFTNQIGIYIPTTIDVDQQVNTTVYIEKSLEFMGKLFGGATHEKVRGVWNSEEVGIVAEDIHLIRSFCSPALLNQQLNAVVDFMEAMKQELKQEAMALEINNKMMLI